LSVRKVSRTKPHWDILTGIIENPMARKADRREYPWWRNGGLLKTRKAETNVLYLAANSGTLTGDEGTLSSGKARYNLDPLKRMVGRRVDIPSNGSLFGKGYIPPYGTLFKPNKPIKSIEYGEPGEKSRLGNTEIGGITKSDHLRVGQSQKHCTCHIDNTYKGR
jgi:hypothetical protein